MLNRLGFSDDIPARWGGRPESAISAADRRATVLGGAIERATRVTAPARAICVLLGSGRRHRMAGLDGALAVLPNARDALTKLFEVEKVTA